MFIKGTYNTCQTFNIQRDGANNINVPFFQDEDSKVFGHGPWVEILSGLSVMLGFSLAIV
ncbi:unnamed protein product [Lupinus luteus]|uniref:Uncharacterized protein n=1 Tax=Lupinus luteus TaxID=3873 RepID=A0AAV1XCK9_LUPLU